MGIKCGIVGLPNVGKSTLFNALTKAGIAAAELSVLHHRAERRRGAGAGSAPERAGARSSSRRRSSRPRWSSSTSPGWSPARVAAARAWATSSWPTSARSMRSRTWCAASSTRDVIHVSRQGRPASPTSTRSTPSWRWPTSTRVDKALNTRRALGQEPATRKRHRAQAGRWRRLRAALNEGKSARRGLSASEEQGAPVRDLFLLTLKPVMYVANVLEDGFENNPHLDAGARARGGRRAPKWCRSAAAIEEELSPAGRRRPRRLPGRHGPGRAGPEPGDPRRPTSCWACRPTSPPA